ncbi:hypothetical protein J132_09347 [Termitomyces sp. J132]|nr:hypothetical protein J132_09347 [Termitomyces sp. J132]
MALDEALCLGLTCNTDICLRMESANSQVNTSVGLAKNVPFTFAEGFTIYLQVHIFVKPAYTVLLGCPFDTLTESNIQKSSRWQCHHNYQRSEYWLLDSPAHSSQREGAKGRCWRR